MTLTDYHFTRQYSGRLRIILSPLLLFMLFCNRQVQAQVNIFDVRKEKDTITRFSDPPAKQKRFGRAALELGLAEIVPWTYDRYIVNVDYARISWKTTGHNLKPGSWTWDNDPFQTDQFGHPYHGSMFYSAFRSNGFSFWQSVPATMAGSYLWETFAENQAPAPNDFINTTFGGIVLGEMTYRLSNKIINNHRRGFKRQASEVLGFLVNPMNGLNRILDGKWGKVVGPASRSQDDSSKVSAEFDLGARKFNSGNQGLLTHGRFGWFGRAKLLYGASNENLHTPFSNISITAEFGKDDSSAVNVISVYGSLAGWDVSLSDSVENLIIISANYDYIRNAAFFYGGQSVKANLLSEFKLLNGFKVNTGVGAGLIILGAAPDPHLYRGRNYDYGSGFAINGRAGFNIGNKFYYSINYRGSWLMTINGNKSHYFLHTITNEISYRVLKDLSISAEPGYFRLEGNYKNHPDVDKIYPYLRISTRYRVDL